MKQPHDNAKNTLAAINRSATKAAPPAQQPPALLTRMGMQLGLDGGKLFAALQNTILKGATPEDMMAFCVVATQYRLNPFTKEILAFPSRKGGITPMVTIDGWARIVNDHPAFDGLDFVAAHDANGKLTAMTCNIYRKDRSRSTSVTEYLVECKQNTEPWTKWPYRMLRHKAFIQAARLAFALSGIVDPDETDRYISVGAITGPPLGSDPEAQAALAEVVAEMNPAQEEKEKPGDPFDKVPDIDPEEEKWPEGRE